MIDVSLKQPRYTLAVRMAIHFIIKNRVSHYPVNVFQIANNNQWVLKPFSPNKILLNQLDDEGTDHLFQKVYSFLLDTDGFVYRNSNIDSNNQIHIFYNSQKSEARTRFTIAHEIGHIVLGHIDHLVVDTNIDVNEKEEIFDVEADVFARNFLAPPMLVKKLIEGSPSDPKKLLMKRFGLSALAAEVRLNFLPNDLFHSRGLNQLSFLTNTQKKSAP